MSGELEGKVTIITGAAAGIGKAAADLFSREGARLVLSDIDWEKGEAVAEVIRNAGEEAIFVAADITREAEVAALVAATESHYGRLDCAFNNAGGGHSPISLLDITLEQWEHYIRINLTGGFLCMKHEIPLMLKSGGGNIAITGSQAGMAATPMMGPYSSAKFGLNGIARSAAAEFASRNIRINVVCPTSTATEGMMDFMANIGRTESELSGPMGRLGRPSEIAEVALWMLSDRSSFVTGQTLAANGGSAGMTA